MYGKLVAKVNNIDTSGFVWITKYDADKSELKNKIPDTSGLVKKTDYNYKYSELENSISNISGLTTTTALTAIKSKHIIKQKLVNLKQNLLLIIMTNILLLLSFIS